MKVLYDISVLAQARRAAKARTGVFRVVDHVARGLAASGECRLSLCVAEGVREPINFLAADPHLNGASVAIAPRLKSKLNLYGRIHSLTDRITSSGSRVESVYLKAVRKSLHHLAELTDLPNRVLSDDALASADIYHSPFHPIPQQAREARGIKKFLTIYDLIPVLYPQFFEPVVNRLFPSILESLRPADFALCISQSTKNNLCEYRPDLDPARIFVTRLAASELFHPHADEASRHAARLKYRIPEGVPYLLTLSTLEPRKNIEQVVKCFARLVREQGLRDLRLVLVGTKGWDYDRIFEAIESFDISPDSIILTGYVADEDLAALYGGALAFIYLSLYEGFGLPPLEAMQCGTPVITSNTSALPEVVGDAGVMHDPTDEDGICQSILDIYRNDALRAEMSRHSLQRAGQFSWERCTQETLAAYRFALGQ